MDVVKTLFERLQYEEEKLPVLLDGKAHLVNVNEATLKEVITTQNVGTVFECLNTSNAEQITTAVFILKMLLPILKVEEKLKILSEQLRKGLDHDSGDVQDLCLKEFQVCSVTDVGNRMLLANENVLCRIIELVGEENMTTALQAADVLSGFGAYSLPAAKVMLTGSLLTSLKKVMEKKDSVRYRVYDVVVKVQAKSEKHLSICVHSHIIQQLINELSGDDVLIKVNCIASLSEMALTKHSLHYLKQSGVVEKLIQMITNAASDPLADLYMPEIVKFFGKMCHLEGPQHIIEIFPQFLPTLFSLVEERDPVKRKVAIETIGFIGGSVEGKHVLAKMGSKTLAAIQEICAVVRSEGDELRLIAINALSQLIRVKRDEQTEDVTGLTLQWFQCLSSDPVDTVVTLCKQPFTKIKCAGMHLVETLAGLEWGMAVLVEFPTFTEYILDRSSDNDKESKEARHEAVKALAESPHCKHVFGNNNWLKFQGFVREGPFFAQSVPSVATEEA